MLWCVVAVVMLFGVSLLLALLAGDHRMRQVLARREHHRMRCLVASQMISALRRALTPVPLVPAADHEAEEDPRPSLAETADDAIPAIVEEIALNARENPIAFGRAIQFMIRGATSDNPEPALARAGS